MNYIQQINAFYDWLETNSIPDSCIVLWHALMHICNKAGWVTEFAVAISTLESKTGMKKDAIIRARQRLKQEGRIGFKSRSGQQSAVYHMIPFESQKPTQNTSQNDCVGLSDTNRNTNRAQSATQTAHKPRPLYKLNKTKLNKIKNISPPKPPKGGRDSPDAVREVYKYYCQKIRECQLTKTRQTKIGARLKEYTIDQLKTAIDNLAIDPWILGDNPNGKFYATLEYVFRNTEKTEEWIKKFEKVKSGGMRPDEKAQQQPQESSLSRLKRIARGE
jgi:hypothetical protein